MDLVLGKQKTFHFGGFLYFHTYVGQGAGVGRVQGGVQLNFRKPGRFLCPIIFQIAEPCFFSPVAYGFLELQGYAYGLFYRE
ncbi:hypothetical protein D9M68_937040 [compost metagenome]